MSTLRFALALSIAAVVAPALAQSSRSTMNSYNDNNFTTNGQQQITGAKANAMNDMIINSMGVLGDTNTWTGSNTFTGPVTFPGIPTPTTPTNVITINPSPTNADMSGAISAALSVPASGATIAAAGSGYAVGDVITPATSNAGLICTTLPTFQVASLSGSAIASLTLATPGLCANTTPIPTPPSSSPTPTFYAMTGGTGTGATIAIAWAAANVKLQFGCGVFTVAKSIGAVHDNTEIAGSGDCTVIKAASSVPINPNWGGNYGTGASATDIFSNADFANGNSNIRIHDMSMDTTAVAAGTMVSVAFGGVTNGKVDHISFLGRIPASNLPNSGAFYAVKSNYLWADHNRYDGFLNPLGFWEGSSNWWVTDSIFEGHGQGVNAIANNGLGSALTYPPVQNITTNGYITGNVFKSYVSAVMNILGLCNTTTHVCGKMNNIIVSKNIIDGSVNSYGIYAGGGDNYKIVDNIISNVGGACIEIQGEVGTTTSNSEVSRNICKNANLTHNAGVDGIALGGTNEVMQNTTIEDNAVTGGGYRYAVSILSAGNKGIASAAVASTTGANAVGDVLTVVGGTLAAGVPAAKLVVTSVDGSGNITGVGGQTLNAYSGSYSAIPANPVSVTSSGTGTGITLNLTWVSYGSFNTYTRPGIADAGTSGAFLIQGPRTPNLAVPATFANLPTCDAAHEGAIIPVTDSNIATWGSTIAGGGTNNVMGFCNGALWTVFAK